MLPSGWNKVDFGSVAKNFDARRVPVKKADRNPGPYPYYGASGVVDYVDDYLFDGELLLIAEDGENLNNRKTPIAFLAKGKFWVNNHTHVVQGNDKALTRYLMYYFQWTDIDGYITGSAQPKLTQDNLNRIPILLPPIDEQESIIKILSTLDDKIDLNHQMNHTLEAMAQAIFKSWFMDFDPVTAKADSRQPYGMNAETAALFPSHFVESELGAVPEGWPVKTLPEIIEVNPKRELANGTSAQYLEMANMPTKGHTPNTWTIRSAGSGMRFMNGDTLMARITPCLENGKTAYVDFLADGEIAWGSTEYIVLRPKEPLPSVYGYCVAKWDDFRDFSIAAMTGSSGRQRVPASNLKFFKMVMPGERVARKFGELVTPLFEKARANTNESITLAKLRDLLLPKLLSGEIRVNQAEKLVEEVA